MEAAAFDIALRSFVNRKPFKPFEVEFVSGGRLQVDHPEALITRHGVAFHFATDGNPTLFDHESVSKVTGIKGEIAANS
jgi:hypothetical protein